MSRPDETAAQLERDTRALALDHGRRVGRPGHLEARTYLVNRLTEIGARPFTGDGFVLPYQSRPWRGIEFANIVGRIPGTGSRNRPILIGAHYDSVIDAPCADDNATACAVGLAAAAAFARTPIERDVVIAFFDAEEPPFFLSPAMGSIRFYEDQRDGLDFAAVIVMDLIGHDVEMSIPAPGLEELVFVLGAESHGALPGAVEAAAAEVDGLRVVPTLNSYIGDMSDHHAFRLGGQPYLFLSCGQGRFYHMPSDTPEWVNFDKVARVYDLVVAIAREVARDGVDVGAPDPPTVEFEIRMLERAFGPALDGVKEMVGIPTLETRAHLDEIVRLLILTMAV